MKNSIKKIFFLLIALSFLSEPGKACSCRYTKKMTIGEFRDYDYIGFGVITNIDTSNNVHFVVKIEKTLKGQITSETINVETNLNIASCGMSVKIGQKWLFFLRKTGSNYFDMDRCSRNRLIYSQNKLDFEINHRLPSGLRSDLRQIKRHNKKLRAPALQKK